MTILDIVTDTIEGNCIYGGDALAVEINTKILAYANERVERARIKLAGAKSMNEIVNIVHNALDILHEER